jgi:hypothetical protein
MTPVARQGYSWPKRRATSLPSTRMSGIADSPVPEMDDPVSARGKGLAMGCDQDGNSSTTLFAHDRIDFAGRLIGEGLRGAEARATARPARANSPPDN